MINRYIRHHQTVVTRPWRLHYALTDGIMVHPPPTQICAGRQVCHFSERLSMAEHVSISCWLRNLCTTPSETMENDGNLPSKNRLLILPTYKPLIFRNTFRCSDDQSSIKVNEGHKHVVLQWCYALWSTSSKKMAPGGTRSESLQLAPGRGWTNWTNRRIPCCLQFGDLSLWTFRQKNTRNTSISVVKRKLKMRVLVDAWQFFNLWYFPRISGWFLLSF